MTLKRRLESVNALGQADADRDQGRDEFAGPWFTNKTAALYVCCKSVNSFYMWKKRHFIVSRSNGTVAKADLDRALKAKKRPRVMAAASLRNLERRSHAGECRASRELSGRTETV